MKMYERGFPVGSALVSQQAPSSQANPHPHARMRAICWPWATRAHAALLAGCSTVSEVCATVITAA